MTKAKEGENFPQACVYLLGDTHELLLQRVGQRDPLGELRLRVLEQSLRPVRSRDQSIVRRDLKCVYMRRVNFKTRRFA